MASFVSSGAFGFRVPHYRFTCCFWIWSPINKL